MLAVAANDGGYAASLQTLTPYVPPNEGNAGVYVPPSNRPAMTPTWGTVQPIGISSVTLAALEATDPRRLRGDQPGPHLASLRPCRYCRRNARAPAPAYRVISRAPAARRVSPRRAPAEAQAALFWNDPGGTLQPPGHWLQIADTIAMQGGTQSAADRARDSHGRPRAGCRGHRRLGDQIPGRCMAARDRHPGLALAGTRISPPSIRLGRR